MPRSSLLGTGCPVARRSLKDSPRQRSGQPIRGLVPVVTVCSETPQWSQVGENSHPPTSVRSMPHKTTGFPCLAFSIPTYLAVSTPLSLSLLSFIFFLCLSILAAVSLLSRFHSFLTLSRLSPSPSSPLPSLSPRLLPLL